MASTCVGDFTASKEAWITWETLSPWGWGQKCLALSQQDYMGHGGLDDSKLGPTGSHKTDSHAQKCFPNYLQIRFRKHPVHICYSSVRWILNREHRKLRSSRNHFGNSIFERAARQWLEVRASLRASLMRIRTQLSLKGYFLHCSWRKEKTLTRTENPILVSEDIGWSSRQIGVENYTLRRSISYLICIMDL